MPLLKERVVFCCAIDVPMRSGVRSTSETNSINIHLQTHYVSGDGA